MPNEMMVLDRVAAMETVRRGRTSRIYFKGRTSIGFAVVVSKREESRMAQRLRLSNGRMELPLT